MACTEPPVCVPCVAVSMRLCLALRRGVLAVRVREFEVVGVRGALYRKGMFGPVALEDVVAVELPHGTTWLAQEAERTPYEHTFLKLQEMALPPADSVELVAERLLELQAVVSGPMSMTAGERGAHRWQ